MAKRTHEERIQHANETAKKAQLKALALQEPRVAAVLKCVRTLEKLPEDQIEGPLAALRQDLADATANA